MFDVYIFNGSEWVESGVRGQKEDGRPKGGEGDDDSLALSGRGKGEVDGRKVDMHMSSLSLHAPQMKPAAPTSTVNTLFFFTEKK